MSPFDAQEMNGANRLSTVCLLRVSKQNCENKTKSKKRKPQALHFKLPRPCFTFSCCFFVSFISASSLCSLGHPFCKIPASSLQDDTHACPSPASCQKKEKVTVMCPLSQPCGVGADCMRMSCLLTCFVVVCCLLCRTAFLALILFQSLHCCVVLLHFSFLLSHFLIFFSSPFLCLHFQVVLNAGKEMIASHLNFFHFIFLL